MKPVAYMFKCVFSSDTDVSIDKPNEQLYPNNIPLYEKQKPLSDDEIKEVWNEMSCVKIDDWQYQFAKAIEERHGIK